MMIQINCGHVLPHQPGQEEFEQNCKQSDYLEWQIRMTTRPKSR